MFRTIVVHLDLLNDDNNFARCLTRLLVAVPMLEMIGLIDNWSNLSFDFNLCTLAVLTNLNHQRNFKSHLNFIFKIKIKSKFKFQTDIRNQIDLYFLYIDTDCILQTEY